MSRNLTETIIGAVVLSVAGYFLMTVYQHTGARSSGDEYIVSAQFSDVTGVGIGSDVRVGGVKIGAVQAIDLDTESYQANVTLSLRDDVALPLDTSAAIVGESLLGGKFVSLEPGNDDILLKTGDVIEFTQASISLEQLIGKFIFSGGGVEDDADDEFELSAP